MNDSIPCERRLQPGIAPNVSARCRRPVLRMTRSGLLLSDAKDEPVVAATRRSAPASDGIAGGYWELDRHDKKLKAVVTAGQSDSEFVAMTMASQAFRGWCPQSARTPAAMAFPVLDDRGPLVAVFELFSKKQRISLPWICAARSGRAFALPVSPCPPSWPHADSQMAASRSTRSFRLRSCATASPPRFRGTPVGQTAAQRRETAGPVRPLTP